MVFIPLPVIFLLISGLRYWFSRTDTQSKGQTIIEEPSLRSAMHMLFELPSSPQILKSKTIRVVLAFEHLDINVKQLIPIQTFLTSMFSAISCNITLNVEV